MKKLNYLFLKVVFCALFGSSYAQSIEPTVKTAPPTPNAAQTVSSAIQCSNNSQCTQNQYCAKEAGKCNGRGYCKIKPEFCIMQYDPVCGCDGKTHSNGCRAATNGINVKVKGECPE